MGSPIDKITLQGFKSIRALDLPLGKLNILIGANGAGKSNFVSFFRLLSAIADERLQKFVLEQGGPDDFFFMGPKYTPRISAHVVFGEHAYEFELSPTTSTDLMIGEERIHHAGGHDVGGTTYARRESSRESCLKWHHGLPQALREFFRTDVYGHVSGWIVYHFHDTSMLAPMRRQGSVRDNEYLRPDAGNLAAFLLMLRERHSSVYAKIRETVRLAAPFFDDFTLRPKASNGDEALQLEWTQRDSDYPFHVNQLSDGTLRFMALTTALLQPDPPATMLFDEPELGLHPYALNLFAGLVKKAATRTQIIVSTQSAPLLDNFEAEDIIVVDRQKGESIFRRLSSDDLAEWRKDYSLGELWQKNVFGGRPADD